MILVNPDNLAEVWSEVRKGLVSILAKTHEPWLPEDVYLEIKQRIAVLYVRTGGFIVLKADGQALDIWCAYNEAGDFESGFDWLKEHARQHGFKRLTMSSPRKGWMKLFNVESYNYRIDL